MLAGNQCIPAQVCYSFLINKRIMAAGNDDSKSQYSDRALWRLSLSRAVSRCPMPDIFLVD
jgi:hypothetical protein